MKIQQAQQWTILMILLSLMGFSGTLVGGEEQQQQQQEGQFEESGSVSRSGSEEEEPLLYFYLIDPNSPIIEEEVPEGENAAEEERPDFIYNPNSGHRLVEFYAHWCPHCQHFRRHYIEFAYGLRLMADRYDVEIDTYAVSCVPHKPVCVDQDVHQYPRMKLFLDGSTEGIEINVWELHPFHVLRHIPGVDLDLAAEAEMNEELQQQKQRDEEEDTNNKKLRKKSKTAGGGDVAAEFWLPRTKQDIYNDAYLSFDFAMRNGIFTTPNPLVNQTAEAFENFVLLLQSTLPPSFLLTKMIADIVDNLEDVKQSETNLIAILDKHPPKVKKWSSSCQRDNPYGGFTCGLWELFHIMSIGFMEYNVWNVGDDWSYYHPSDVATMLHDFVEHFFGCEVCRLNFLQSYDACDHDRCMRLIHEAGSESDWREFPMWLWETHNSVNLRLSRENAERENRLTTREEEFATQWPSRTACKVCWHPDGRWEPEMIYFFLRLTYWPEDPLSGIHRQKMIEAADDDDAGNADDDEDDGEGQSFIPMIIGSVVLFSLASLYREQQRVARTGRHKKTDA